MSKRLSEHDKTILISTMYTSASNNRWRAVERIVQNFPSVLETCNSTYFLFKLIGRPLRFTNSLRS